VLTPVLSLNNYCATLAQVWAGLVSRIKVWWLLPCAISGDWPGHQARPRRRGRVYPLGSVRLGVERGEGLRHVAVTIFSCHRLHTLV
jgi:hypothetical protein